MTDFTSTDHQLMTRALRLAERGAFTTKPNPMVGCVIAHGDEIVGEGWHRRAGEPHAEILALQAAGERAKGATVYVTLEPCAHTGRTGPCADALVAAGVGKVIAAMRDPFPRVDGAGFDRLRAAGIEVRSGLLEAQARQLNCGFISCVERGRPWVRVKLGTSLDGRTAMANGDSKWITGEASRRDVHLWRARSGAILTGANTVLVDDPSLTVRLEDDTAFVAPLRVVLDPGLATVARGRVREGDAPTLYLHAPDARLPRDFAAQHQAVPVARGVFDLHAVLKLLAERQVNEVLVETGATLAGAFLAAGLADEVLLYVAPVLLGDKARPLFAGLGIDQMAQRLHLEVVESRVIGEDTRLLLRSRELA
ncbi:bifunctional diaminohydroxyphosphoribosylaminopyrimidine deaminase/5-amino-6-(5-phosphoribosylamino)uracil reductase RibD [Pseudoxanthomonas sangjuensis]|uniref:bifunctional diaminohydroxyphosphoribosylaminopyrimidine deaminase/5-amino-6-(5-phosphoribosylamino)uracil reductase RibD n=1 Tax=Pseudoxanthomonas sangjuensis TaxID=1503750 RepID=UPI001391EBF4|nr:bifunctional diaminohydroxyphosphoribosylaminopyrimidine deaminase/5-amino-6-(5-phosphoribosylamino)uracil reductase RibD [Pseudoxanthomonas sangjuensis]KAF1708251.1 riboflavin biosynthesis protein RibD [Pseudoxanthomonas sangjuensis]